MIAVPFVFYASCHSLFSWFKIEPFVASTNQGSHIIENKETENLLKPTSILTSVYFGLLPTFAYIIHRKWRTKPDKEDAQAYKIYLSIYVLLLFGLFLSQLYWMSMSIVYPISYTRSLTPDEIQGGIISVTKETTIPYLAPLMVTPFIWVVIACVYTRILFHFLSKKEILELFSYDRWFREPFI